MAYPSRLRPLLVMTALVAALVGSAGSSSASDPNAANAVPWEKVRSEDGIEVSRKEVPGSPFVAFRGEGDVDYSLVAVASVLMDVPHQTAWLDRLVEARMLREVSPTEYIMYTHFSTPPTLADRDFVSNVNVALDPAKKTLTVKIHSVTDALAPKTSYVRGELAESSFTLTSSADGKKTRVVAEIHCDPKGGVPGWMVNMFQKNWGYNTIKSLRHQVALGGSPTPPRLSALLQANGMADQAVAASAASASR